MIFALAGNQNCGKTTLFNQLTGSNQHVGNFPGITVDRKSGYIKNLRDCSVVDLPGIYSIRPYTNEETVARDFILNQKPDGIINIVDATNIERNLYLTLQLIDIGIPMVLALNMMDEVRGNSGFVDIKGISELLGIPAVPISAIKNEGVSRLISVAAEVAKKRLRPQIRDFSSPDPVRRCIDTVSGIIEKNALMADIPVRFAATNLIEGDGGAFKEKLALSDSEIELIEHSVIQMERERGLDRNAALADMRYSFIESVCQKTVVKPRESRERIRSEKLDRALTGKRLAVPIFIGIMLLVFFLTFTVIGPYLSDLTTAGIEALTGITDAALTRYGINPVVQSLIIDGVFQGVGSVLSFLPIIVVLFFFLSILEDTGYMARIAFIMDKPFRKIGLSGKSVVPMLIGFGCTVPAVMATRTLTSKRDRTATILLAPFMSCSAKIPIYAVFSAAFFPGYSAVVMIALYALGIFSGVIAAMALKAAFGGGSVPFVMELPNYRFASFKSVLLLMRDKSMDFIKRAFTVIFLASIVIWFLQTFDARINVVNNSSASMLAGIGRYIAPIFNPLGFGDWRTATALISGFVAKESVVSTLGVLLGTSDLSQTLPALFTPRTAASFLIFTLLYTPCVAAVGVIRKELSSSFKAFLASLMQCLIAWVAAYTAAVILRLLLLGGGR